MISEILRTTILASSLLMQPHEHNLNHLVNELVQTSSCPTPYELKLPKYGVENIVAQAPSYQVSLKKDFVTINWHFMILAYSTTSHYNEIVLMKDNEIGYIFKRLDIEVIEMYEKNQSGNPFQKPSVIIYKDIEINGSKKVYIKFDFQRLKGDNSEEYCENNLNESVLRNSGIYVTGRSIESFVNELRKKEDIPKLHRQLESHI